MLPLPAVRLVTLARMSWIPACLMLLIPSAYAAFQVLGRGRLFAEAAWVAIGKGFAVVAVLGIMMVALNVRMIRRND